MLLLKGKVLKRTPETTNKDLPTGEIEIECKELIDQLFATEHPYYCPHGRPIIINLSINERLCIKRRR